MAALPFDLIRQSNEVEFLPCFRRSQRRHLPPLPARSPLRTAVELTTDRTPTSLPGREAALLEQRLHVRVAPAELPVGLAPIRGIARREDVLAQLVRGRLMEDVAGLHER